MEKVIFYNYLEVGKVKQEVVSWFHVIFDLVIKHVQYQINVADLFLNPDLYIDANYGE